MSGMFGALKNLTAAVEGLTDEVKAMGEVQRFTRRDIERIAKCMDETLDGVRTLVSVAGTPGAPASKPGFETRRRRTRKPARPK